LLTNVFATRRNRIIGAAIGVVFLLGGVALALSAGGGDEPPPTTTTTTTAPSTTTTPPTTLAPPVAPLTGLPGDAALIGRPALVVKIDNVEPKARPQVGINQADVVYEERVEGSVTRLLAVFQSADSAPVGPVRSARTSDLGVLSVLHRPYFVWSGANGNFAARIREANLADLGYDVASGYYYRASDRHAPDNLMLTSTAEVMALPSPGATTPPPLFTYRTADQVPAHLEPVTGVHITYGNSAGSAPVDYVWNGQGWARSQKGTPHVDVYGQQVAPANVIVQFTPYASSGVNDQFGVPIPEVQWIGEGDAWVLTNGGLIAARWHRASIDTVTTYTDADGAPILLTPGTTWVALPAPGDATKL
jgi:hypothetical protein